MQERETSQKEEWITYPEITQYIHKILPEETGMLQKIEEYVAGDYFPIIKKETAAFLKTMCKLYEPHAILEVGTAVGYSAILLQQSSAKDCKVTTIERYERAAAIAKKHFLEAGLSSQITLLFGDASQILPSMTSSFDFIFLDAAKGQYPKFLPLLYDLLAPGGVLICDNVLYRGMVSDLSLVERRKRTLVKRLQIFLETIMNYPGLTTSLLPLGDGITISVKEKKEP